MKHILAAVIFGIAVGGVAPAAAQTASVCAPPIAAALCHEILVPASVDEVWQLFTTSNGLQSWMAPVAAIDLRVGGMMEASYARAARIGEAGNIQNRVLSYLPERMLSISIARAPPNFPHADVARSLWTVIELEPSDETATRVRVTMLGYGEGEAFDALARHFNAGNAWTLEKLHERVTQGPVDWAALGGAP